uniref:Class S F-box protein n=1 Tax=Solanum tuberosum TaxID=4113 RepID=M1CCQ4_SOLTU
MTPKTEQYTAGKRQIRERHHQCHTRLTSLRQWRVHGEDTAIDGNMTPTSPSAGCKASGKYKVLRFVARKVTKVSELEVYTLGVGEKWRNVGEISCPVWYKFDKVKSNGALHWMDSEKNDTIYSFVIETEKVKSLPAPPGLVTPPWNLKLVELGNYLCLTDYYNTSSTNIDIWWMKEYGVSESWTKEIILVDSVPRGMVHINFEPILMWKDGEILIQ